MPANYLETMEKQVDLKEVTDLLALADRPESDGLSGMTTRAAALKDGLGLYSSAKEKVDGLVKTVGKALNKEEDFKKSVNIAINSAVQLLKDLITKVNAHGGMLKEILDDMKKRPADEQYREELVKLRADFEQKRDLEAEMIGKTEALEKEFQKKHDALDWK